ncbi:uracil-DNA glycosylase [Halarcobacter sp.]|uniref:uracil-DNA glycosylase n=1 Tax=Halarcobacter sp. TaxID=2321133 RepID=UPI002AA7A380|nr:uracil-DNA glycosylase [Halarcobacter sp.]
MEKRIVCQKCIYYFVTWQPTKPHGCKAYGFKSQLIPSVVVKNSSGSDCSFFQLKNSN